MIDTKLQGAGIATNMLKYALQTTEKDGIAISKLFIADEAIHTIMRKLGAESIPDWYIFKTEANTTEEVYESNTNDIKLFLSDKKFINPHSKMFLYHGTNKLPKDFILRHDYEWQDSNTWSGDLPEGYLFLTTSIKEAQAYGMYIIPCELKKYSHISFKVDSDNPSRVFDMDYGIDLYIPDKYFNFWKKFEESGKSSLIIKGNNKWTIITDIDNIIPRTDLATDFYKTKV